jgi:hypothetical protein
MTGPVSRRRVVATLGAGVGGVLAGCLGSGDPEYEDGTVDNVSGGNRTAQQMNTASSLAESEPSDQVTPMDVLELVSHEFVFVGGYAGSTVQGIVQNTGDDRTELAEVRVRVYNDRQELLGLYLASTSNLAAGETWSFQVIILESPDVIADYDIAVLGTPT